MHLIQNDKLSHSRIHITGLPGPRLSEGANEGVVRFGCRTDRIWWRRCIVRIKDFMQERDKNDDPIVASGVRARFYSVEP